MKIHFDLLYFQPMMDRAKKDELPKMQGEFDFVDERIHLAFSISRFYRFHLSSSLQSKAMRFDSIVLERLVRLDALRC